MEYTVLNYTLSKSVREEVSQVISQSASQLVVGRSVSH